MGFDYKAIQKNIYIDGHEPEDVVACRNNIFLIATKTRREVSKN
jgi:hypothetical protein